MKKKIIAFQMVLSKARGSTFKVKKNNKKQQQKKTR